MHEVTSLILDGLEPTAVEESEDDRPSWKKSASKIPYVKFRADVRRHVSPEEFLGRIEHAFRSVGFKDITRNRVDGSGFWHIIIHTHTPGDSATVISSSDQGTVSVSTIHRI